MLYTLYLIERHKNKLKRVKFILIFFNRKIAKKVVQETGDEFAICDVTRFAHES